MSEKEKKHGWPDNMVERLLGSSFLGILETAEDDDQAKELAHWGLLQFLSGDVQRIKRSIYLSEDELRFRVCDLIDNQVTIVRSLKDDVFNWFIIVQVGQDNYLYGVGTPGNMGTLEPRVQDYSIDEIRILNHEEAVCFLDEEQLIELMSLDSRPDKFDIVFSGYMEEERAIVFKQSSVLIPQT